MSKIMNIGKFQAFIFSVFLNILIKPPFPLYLISGLLLILFMFLIMYYSFDEKTQNLKLFGLLLKNHIIIAVLSFIIAVLGSLFISEYFEYFSVILIFEYFYFAYRVVKIHYSNLSKILKFLIVCISPITSIFVLFLPLDKNK